MIEKYNIPIEDKLTKKIEYTLSLDINFWYKIEYDSRGKEIYFGDNRGFSVKTEHTNLIMDDR
jgi:hypothetical protein